MTIISTIDDLNYPEKTDTYYIVNAPYIFAACWKVKILCSIFVLKSVFPIIFQEISYKAYSSDHISIDSRI